MPIFRGPKRMITRFKPTSGWLAPDSFKSMRLGAPWPCIFNGPIWRNLKILPTFEFLRSCAIFCSNSKILNPKICFKEVWRTDWSITMEETDPERTSAVSPEPDADTDKWSFTAFFAPEKLPVTKPNNRKDKQTNVFQFTTGGFHYGHLISDSFSPVWEAWSTGCSWPSLWWISWKCSCLGLLETIWGSVRPGRILWTIESCLVNRDPKFMAYYCTYI